MGCIGKGLLLAAGLIGILFIVGATAPDRTKEAPKPIGMMDMDVIMQRDVTAAIVTKGYQCPLAKWARSYGAHPLGTYMQIWCGPPQGKDLYANLVYEIRFDQGNRAHVRPWSGDPQKSPISWKPNP